MPGQNVKRGEQITISSAHTAPSARKSRSSWQNPQGRHPDPEADQPRFSRAKWSSVGGRFISRDFLAADGPLLGQAQVLGSLTLTADQFNGDRSGACLADVGVSNGERRRSSTSGGKPCKRLLSDVPRIRIMEAVKAKGTSFAVGARFGATLSSVCKIYRSRWQTEQPDATPTKPF